MTAKLTFATRPSALARWQTDYVIRLLQAAWSGLACEIVVITTRGDRVLDKPLPEIGGKGLFTLELEDALRSGKVDAAVHSLKDLPTEDAPNLVVGAIPERADPRDVWICPSGAALETIHPGAIVGTSSIRRQAQILAQRPDVVTQPIRGNVETRLRKAQEGQYDAIVLAAAGLTRLGLEEQITDYFNYKTMLPAPGQGALGIQCRAKDKSTLELLGAIEDPGTRMAVTAERAFLERLGGGCSLPVGANANVAGNDILLHGVVIDPDGGLRLELTNQGQVPEEVGADLAQKALSQGAAELLEGVA